MSQLFCRLRCYLMKSTFLSWPLMHEWWRWPLRRLKVTRLTRALYATNGLKSLHAGVVTPHVKAVQPCLYIRWTLHAKLANGINTWEHSSVSIFAQHFNTQSWDVKITRRERRQLKQFFRPLGFWVILDIQSLFSSIFSLKTLVELNSFSRSYDQR